MKVIMKKKNRIYRLAFLGILSLFFSQGRAQNDADLLRFSMTNPIGTARYNAMGGAFGSLGANFTALSTNPAGIGLYSRHEISLTGGFLSGKGASDYYGETNNMNLTRGVFPQGGGVFVIYDNAGRKNGLRRLQFAFGANRIKDFNANSYSSAVNPSSSYMQYVAAISSGYDFATEYGQSIAHIGNLAYQTGLMDYKDTVNMLYETFLGPGLRQKRILQESGNITEMTLSFGGDWSEKLYFGMTIGIPIVDYTQKSSIEEVNQGQALPHNFNSYSIDQTVQMSGTGLNLKLGLIYKPYRFFRIGLAFHTPTYYWLKEQTRVDMQTNMQYALGDGSFLPNNAAYRYNDEYSMVSPMRGILSFGFLVKNFGSFSVEGEITDYRMMRLDVSEVDYQNTISAQVKDNYKVSGVVRAGTEWKVGLFSFRAGYIWQSCPYSNVDLRKNWSNHTATAGLGLTLGSWNLDFGFMADLGKRTDDFYYIVDEQQQPLVDPAVVRFYKYAYTLSLGYRF